MKKYEKTIVLVGGGTGGHAMPIRSLYDKLIETKPALNIVVVGVGGATEEKFFGSIPNYKKIKAGKLHRYLTLKNIIEPFKFVWGFFQSILIIWQNKPELIFSKGGFVSMPMIFAARVFGVPYSIHESDSIMGVANRTMVKSAQKVFVTFPVELYPKELQLKMVWSGPILRKEFESIKGEQADFEFNTKKPVILLTGGSQGSYNLSDVFIKIVRKLLPDFNIIHQAGKHSIALTEKFRESLGSEEKESYYITEMLGAGENDNWIAALNIADLVIARAGSTIVELSIKGKPMILVPWKDSAQNHQVKNAQFLKKKDAAVVIEEGELTEESLLRAIESLWQDKEKLKLLSKNASAIFPDKNSSKIVDWITEEK